MFKKADNKWSVDGVKEFDTDSQIVGNFIGDFSGFKAEEFLENPDAQKVQQFKKDSIATVKWTDAKTVTTTLYLGEVDKTLYAAFDPTVRMFKLGGDAKSKLDKKLESFRNKKVFAFQSSDVVALDIDGKKFKRVGESWYTDADAGKFDAAGKFTGKKGEEPKEDTSARTLLVDIEHVKADSFLDAADGAVKKLAAAPQHKIVLQMKDQTQLEVTGWQDPDLPEKAILKQSKTKFAYRVGKSVFSSLNKDAKPAESLNLPPMGAPGEAL